MSRKLICVCNFVTEKEILSAIAEGGVTLDDIKEETGAGTSCGKCHLPILKLLGQSDSASEPTTLT